MSNCYRILMNELFVYRTVAVTVARRMKPGSLNLPRRQKRLRTDWTRRPKDWRKFWREKMRNGNEKLGIELKLETGCKWNKSGNCCVYSPPIYNHLIVTMLVRMYAHLNDIDFFDSQDFKMSLSYGVITSELGVFLILKLRNSLFTFEWIFDAIFLQRFGGLHEEGERRT